MTLQIPKLLCTFIVCVGIATIAAAQQVSAPAPQTGTIVGTVLDVNGGTVPSARVALQEPDPKDHRTLVTPDNGSFKFDDLKPRGPYHVNVSAQGFANWTSQDVILKPGQFFILTGIRLRVATVQVSVNAVTPEQLAIEQVKAEERQRVFGLVPNFYVSYEPNVAPLTPELKFQLALRTLVDPVTVSGFGLNAAIYQAAGYPRYTQGAKGYSERLGATFAGGYTNILLGDALLPSLLHQDPRYFYQGTGTTKSRVLHALASAFVTKSDDGRREFNYSGIGGDLASGAIANAYYPAKDRGPGLVLRGALIGAGGRMVEGVVQEFVLHKVTSRHTNQN